MKRHAAVYIACAVLGLAAMGALAYSVLGVGPATPADGDDYGIQAYAYGESVSRAPAVLVRAVDEGASRADGDLYEIRPDGKLRRAGQLACKRVHAVAAGRGLCLSLSGNGVEYRGVVFDERYRPRARFEIDGIPDRARVSPDGRYGAYTAFDEAGAQGYFASSDDFSTNTAIVDMRDGRKLLDTANLEVRHGRHPFDSSESEVWGVVFLGGGGYYATLATDEEGRQGHYLIRGDVRSRKAHVVAKGIECPALSPDRERIAYKRRIGDGNRWRLHVRHLDSGRDVALAETRSIDDQPEWLGNRLVAYSDDRDVLVVAADGTGEPRTIARSATSPAFLSD